MKKIKLFLLINKNIGAFVFTTSNELMTLDKIK